MTKPILLYILVLLTANGLRAQTFGEEFNSSEPMTIESALSELSTQDSIVVTLTGHVTEVCQAKGCWMELNNEPQNIQVTFKDYGFFVPKDLSGNEVVVTGTLYKTIMNVAELKHYAQDKNLPASEIAKIKEPQEKYRIVASGVKILN